MPSITAICAEMPRRLGDGSGALAVAAAVDSVSAATEARRVVEERFRAGLRAQVMVPEAP